MSPYASYAATATDVAGTEHIIWQNNGQLVHAVFDVNAGTWAEARPVSDATGGDNLRLLAGNIYPYLNGEATDVAPGLIGLWEKGTGNSREVYAVVGRYQADGTITWSNEVALTSDGVADQNIDATILDNGFIDVLYQKSLVQDPRDPSYQVNPSQLISDGSIPNRDDTDLYQTRFNIVLSNNGDPSLVIFDGQTIDLTFEDEELPTSIYYPLGPEAQAVTAPSPTRSSSGSGNSSTNSTIPAQSFQFGATRGFDIQFGGPNSFVNGRIPLPSPLLPNFVLQLSGDLQPTPVFGGQIFGERLAAALNLELSHYYQDYGNYQRDPTTVGYSSRARIGGGSPNAEGELGFSIGGFSLNAAGQINYSNNTLSSLQRFFEIGIDFFGGRQFAIGTGNSSLLQGSAGVNAEIGFRVAYTFSDPNPGTKAPFTLQLPYWELGIAEGLGGGINEVAFLLSSRFFQKQVPLGALAAVADLVADLPIIISAFEITMPPWPEPDINRYKDFSFGLEIPITIDGFGTIGLLNNTLRATLTATADIAFQLEIDPEEKLLIPWQVGLHAQAQFGAFTVGWGFSEQGELTNNGSSSTLSEASGNGAVNIGYNPYNGTTNHYETPASQAFVQTEVDPISGFQIGYATLSNGGSNYLNGSSGSFQTFLPQEGVSDVALVTVYVTKGVITNLSVVDQGAGYTGSAPIALEFSSSGGAGGSINMEVIVTDGATNTGKLGPATITAGGSGYLGGKSGIFVVSPSGSSDPAGQPIRQGLLALTVSDGVITAATVIDPGSGYTPGSVQVDLSANGGGGSGAEAQALPIGSQFGNLVNDGPPSISSLTTAGGSTSTAMAWIADGVDDQTLQAPDQAPQTRLLTSSLSGTDWDTPVPVPGVGQEGFNFDPSIGFFLTPDGDAARVVVWAHADSSAITPSSSSEAITEAVLATDIYWSVALSGNEWSTPQLLAANAGADTKVNLGAGRTDAELIATWVNTPDPDPTTGATAPTIQAAIWNGTQQSWAPVATIEPAAGATGRGIASLEVGAFQGNPTLYWSDTTSPGYAWTVLQEAPALYYRLDERRGTTLVANAATGGERSNAAVIGSVAFAEPGALLAANGSGDANTSMGFNGQGYVQAPGSDTTSGLGDLSIEFWLKADSLSPGQSLVDQGLYNAAAVLPSASVPLTIQKSATQNAQGVWGYSYAAAILPTTSIEVTEAGSGLSPFNLDLTSLLPGSLLTLTDGTTITVNSAPILSLNVEEGALSSITTPAAAQILGTTFVADPGAQGMAPTTTALTQDLSFEQVPGWYVRTGENDTIVFNAGGGELATPTLSEDTWYYVVATYNSSTQTATLYLNAEEVASQTGSRFAPSSLPLLLGYEYSGQLDEVAVYNTVLNTNSNPATLNSLGQVSSLQISNQGRITDHYDSRFNDPNAAEDSTFYSVLDPSSVTWGEPIQFSSQAAWQTTNPLLERSPVVDIASASNTQLAPDGKADSRLEITIDPSIVTPGVTITGITITSGEQTWAVGDQGSSPVTPDGLIGVLANGQLLNALDPADTSSFEAPALSTEDNTLDLYFQSELPFGTVVEVVLTTRNSIGVSQQSQPIQTSIRLNPDSTIGEVSAVGQELIATGVILENEVTALNQVDSGVVLDVPLNAGIAVAAGNLLDGQVGIVLSQPSAKDGSGVLWVLPAGSTTTLDDLNLTALATDTAPVGGVLIENVSGATTTSPPQTGNVLAVGDVDGDGIDDLIIASSQATNANGEKSGNVHILSGTQLTANTIINLNDTPGVQLIGQAGSQAGHAIDTGDVNADGIDDVVIGAPYETVAGDRVGAVHVILGSSGFFSSSDPIDLNSDSLLLSGTSGSYLDPYINQVAWTSQVGYSVAVSRGTRGESTSVNGDSFADIIIGAPNYRQEVEFSKDGVNTMASEEQAKASARLLTTLPDTGRKTSYSENLNTGRAYVVFGSSDLPNALTEENLDGSNGVILDGSPMRPSDSQTGYAVSSGGDVNHDGFDDVLIGAPSGNDTTGLSFVVPGRSSSSDFSESIVLELEAGVVVGGSNAFSRSGKTLSLAGDVNGDGIDDILVGAPNASYSTGEGHVLFGSDTLFTEGTTNYSSFQPGARSGILNLNGGSVGQLAAGSLWSGTDINGDGIDDLLLGSPYGSELYAVFGQKWLGDDGNLKLPKLANDQGVVVDQPGSGEKVANLGDINSDGFSDSLMGLTDTAATIIFGGGTEALLDESLGTQDLQVSALPGTSLEIAAAAGDFNGDGAADTFLAQNQTNPQVLVNGSVRVSEYNEKLYATWLVQEGTGSQVVVSESADGLAWSTPVTAPAIPDGDTNIRVPDIVAFNDSLTVYFADNGLFYSQYEGDSGWSASAQTDLVIGTSTGISVSEYDSNLFAVWAGTGDLPELFYSSSSDGIHWAPQQELRSPNQTGPFGNISFSVPTLVNFNNELFAYWSGAAGTASPGTYVSTWDSTPSTWSNPIELQLGLPLGTFADGFEVEAVGDQLVASFITGATGTNAKLLVSTSTDGVTWSVPEEQNQTLITGSSEVSAIYSLPGLAVLGGQPHLLWSVGVSDGSDIDIVGVEALAITSGEQAIVTLAKSESDQFLSLLEGSVGLGRNSEATLATIPAVANTQIYDFAISAGDLNADGFDDIVAGVTVQVNEGTTENKLWIAFGNSSSGLNFEPLEIITNSSVQAAGDVNGDGIDDLILGNPVADDDNGAIYLLPGAANLASEVASGQSLAVVSYVGTSQIIPTELQDLFQFEGQPVPTLADVNANFGNPSETSNPGLSTVVWQGEIISIWANSDQQLLSSYSTDNITWTSASLFPDSWQTNAVPALVEFNNSLYAYWYFAENNTSGTLFNSEYQGQGNWGPRESADLAFAPSGGIDLIEYNNDLYIVYQSGDSLEGNPLFYSKSSDGTQWDPAQGIPNAAIFQDGNIPSLSVFQDKLYTYYAGFGAEGIYYTIYDEATNSWSGPQLTSNLSPQNNALTPFGMSFLNAQDEVLYTALIPGNNSDGQTDYQILISQSSDGINWEVPIQAEQGLYGWGIPNLYLFDNELSVLSPAATNNSASSSSLVNASSQQIVFQPGLGADVASVGDVNGDGYDDVVVLSPGLPNPINPLSMGSGFIRFGNPQGLATADVELYSSSLSPSSTTLARAGDINGDGFDDILIADDSYGNTTVGANSGITYVIFGGPNLADLSSIDLTELQPISTTAAANGNVVDGKIGTIALTDGGSGYLTANGGSGSGSFDIIVTSSTSTEAGVIEATVSGGVIQTVQVTNPGSGFASLKDLLYDTSEGGGGSGAAVAITSLVSLAGFQILGDPGSLAGEFLGGGGDVNGDGFSDILIGAPEDSLSYILFGGDFTASLNQLGSIGADVLEGTATGEVLDGQAGNDVLLGQGGLDVLLGGSGSDWLQVQDTNFRRVDGGSGYNTLALYGYLDQAWDITTLAPGNRIRNIDSIDITDYGSNLLTINSVSVQRLTESSILTVVGDTQDKLNLSSDFQANGTLYAGGKNFNLYQAGTSQVWISDNIPTTSISTSAPLLNQPAPLGAELPSLSSQAGPSGPPSANQSLVGGADPLSTTGPTTSGPTRFQISNPVVAENSKDLVFTVSRSGDPSIAAAAEYRTINGTAKAGIHYHSQTGVVAFAPGETSKTIHIALIDDQSLGSRQREMSLGLTPLPSDQAARLSDRSISFDTQAGSLLGNLESASINPEIALLQAVALPLGAQSFKVSAPNGKAMVSIPHDGMESLNNYLAFNSTVNQYEEFLFDGTTGVEFVHSSGNGLANTLNLHLVDGGRGDNDGVVNGIVSLLSAASQVTPGPIQVRDGVFFIATDSDGKIQFHNRTAAGDFEMGVIAVDDSLGRIDSLLPSDPGYRNAALNRENKIFLDAERSSPQALTSEFAEQSLNDALILVQSESQINGAFQQAELNSGQHYILYFKDDENTIFSVENPLFQARQDSRGFTELSWADQSFEMATPLLLTPGQVGESVQATFEYARGAAFENTIALYKVDSLTGGIDTDDDGVIDLIS